MIDLLSDASSAAPCYDGEEWGGAVGLESVDSIATAFFHYSFFCPVHFSPTSLLFLELFVQEGREF